MTESNLIIAHNVIKSKSKCQNKKRTTHVGGRMTKMNDQLPKIQIDLTHKSDFYLRHIYILSDNVTNNFLHVWKTSDFLDVILHIEILLTQAN